MITVNDIKKAEQKAEQNAQNNTPKLTKVVAGYYIAIFNNVYYEIYKNENLWTVESKLNKNRSFPDDKFDCLTLAECKDIIFN